MTISAVILIATVPTSEAATGAVLSIVLPFFGDFAHRSSLTPSVHSGLFLLYNEGLWVRMEFAVPVSQGLIEKSGASLVFLRP